MDEKKWLQYFGDRLAEKMRDAGFTQDEFANRIGVAPSTVSKYVNKTQVPGLKALTNMSRVLGCTIDELIDCKDEIE